MGSGSGGIIVGDPHFVHPRTGKIYDVQGRGGIYVNLVSNPQVQLNARFAAWDGDKTYISEVGICAFRRRIRIDLEETCDSASEDVEYVPLSVVGDDIKAAAGGQSFLLRRCDDHGILQTRHLDIIELAIAVDSHGLYGQVVARADITPVPGASEGEGVIDGTWEDYIVSNLWASDFKFNRYVEEAQPPPSLVKGGRISGD